MPTGSLWCIEGPRELLEQWVVSSPCWKAKDVGSDGSNSRRSRVDALTGRKEAERQTVLLLPSISS